MNELTDNFQVHVFSETRMFCIEETIHFHVYLTYYPFDKTCPFGQEKIHFHAKKDNSEDIINYVNGYTGVPVDYQKGVKIKANNHSKIVTMKQASHRHQRSAAFEFYIYFIDSDRKVK